MNVFILKTPIGKSSEIEKMPSHFSDQFFEKPDFEVVFNTFSTVK